MMHLLLKGPGVFREEGQKDFKSQRWLITSRKQCFSRYNRSCANVNSHSWQDDQEFTGSSLTKSQHEAGKVAMKPRYYLGSH